MAVNGQKKLVGGGVAAALLLAVPLVAKWEGKSNAPYEDKFVKGLLTVCYGETRVQMRRYSDAECTDMLNEAVKGFAEPVARCTPMIADRPYQLAAATSLAYNIGIGAYCRSTADRRFDAGDMKGGCKAIGRWNMAGGRVVQGLVNRRADEVRLCMTGL